MPVLTNEQRDAFDELGFVSLPGAFSSAEAVAMADRIWATLGERHGVRREAPETWSVEQATGLQDLKADVVFDPIGGPALTGALDELLGSGAWKRPQQWGQFLVTFPPRGAETALPSAALWHADFDFLSPPDQLAGALVFSFLSAVPAHSGGTAILLGSHRVIAQFVARQAREALQPMKRVRKAYMQSDPWLEALVKARGADWLERRLGSEATIDGIRVRVDELTGAAGDVVIGHPWLLHAPAPNRATRPRFMRVQRVHTA